MKNKNRFLAKILKFSSNPIYSSVKEIVEDITFYQRQNSEIIINAKRGSKVEIVDEALFFEYVSQKCGFMVDSFGKIEQILNTKDKKENITLTTNSKNSIISPFEKTLLLRKKEELAKLYKEEDLKDIKVKSVVAIENSESFLEIDKKWNLFEQEYFLYLGGNPKRLIQKFLKDKEVLFYIDLDIVSINFYENIKVFKKELFIPKDFTTLLKKYGNKELYLKQRRFLKKSYSNECKNIIEQIKDEAKVLEQEIF